jgi:3-oxoacyl-(acyl-carrier-protein) synthase/thioesterase domain-containing protein/acyl carrier protein
VPDVSKPTALNRLLAIIEATLKLPPDRTDVDADLESLGINSLIMMELMEAIDREFSVALTPALLADVATLSDLAALLDRLAAGRDGEPPAAAAAAQPAPDLLGYIQRRYAVDLSGRGLGSADELAQALVAEHAEDLLRHYGDELRGDGPGGDAPHAPAPRSAAGGGDIAIVGLSCRLPDAPHARAFWANLMDGRNSVREIPASRWDWTNHYAPAPAPGKTLSKWGALIDDVDRFDAGFFNIPAPEAQAMDPQQRLLLQEAYRAVEDAGIDMKTLAGSSTGVFVGYQYSEYEQQLRRLGNQDMREGPVFSSSSPSYYLANRVSFAFDFRGPSESVNVNCASSAVAIHRACQSLAQGESALAIAGGVSLNLFEGDYIASSQYGLLSPDGSNGVFDDDARGFTRGEGVAVVVLKRLEDAERDQDRIYAVIKASHQNYRGAARSLSEVRHESITDVLGRCYRKAGVDPATLRYIEVDGYATKWADSFEYEGIKNALKTGGPQPQRCALGSLKGNIGNVEAASGVVHLIKLALSLHHQVFPATISKKKLSSFIDIDAGDHPLYIADRAIPLAGLRDGGTPVRAGINSFADSGTNVHILLEEYPGRRRVTAADADVPRLFVLSARNAERLAACVQAHIDHLAAAGDTLSFSSLVYTAQTGREAMGERLAVVASSRGELLQKLSALRACGMAAGPGLEAQGIYRGSADAARRNPLAALITADMAQAQLMHGLHSGQWQPIALLWVHGVPVRWDLLWPRGTVQPTSLPGYAFARDRHWIDAAAKTGGRSPAAAVPSIAPARPLQQPAAGDGWQVCMRAGGEPAPADAMALDGRGKIALFLRQEAARQLDTRADAIATDKSLPDLGLHSIGIAELIRRTDQLLGIRLSPHTVFAHPDIGSLSAYLAATCADRLDALVVARCAPAAADAAPTAAPIAAADAAPEPAPADILVAVQPRGSKPPIFALPGAGGNALSLQQLSHALGSDQPFYCLEPAGLDGRTAPLASVEESAELNIERMKAVQPRGPYRLLGYSNGGVVAFEMARKLVQGRARVSSLVLLDSLCPAARAGHAVEEMVAAVFNRFAASLGVPAQLQADTLRAVPEGERSRYLHGLLAELGVELPRAQFMASFDVATTSEQACRAYRPTRLAQKIDVLLVKASEAYPGAPEDYGWGPFLAGPLRTFAVAANHFSIVDPGPAGTVAKRIAAPVGRPARTAAAAELAASA